MGNLASDLKNPPSKATLGKIAEMLERNQIDLAEVGQIKRISVYQTVTKDDEGRADVHDLTAIQFSPAWEEGPKWPVIQPSKRYKVSSPKVKAKAPSSFLSAAILPDIQMGYYRNMSGELVPTHDEEALKLALNIVREEQPEEVILLGDNLDLPEFGRYRLTQAFEQTTQASLDRAGLFVAELRAAAPNARIRWLAGNHEERMPNYIIDNAKASFGIRRANTPKDWPVMSVPFLLWFDEHDIEYIPGYPAANLWLNERLKIIHGTKHKSNGSTAHKYLDTEKVSVIYGHIHRREYAARTRDDWDGPKEVMAASPGCLARRDGAVPSTKGATDLDGRPLTVVEDWQLGMAMVHFETSGAHRFVYDQIAIHKDEDDSAWCIHKGQMFTSGDTE